MRQSYLLEIHPNALGGHTVDVKAHSPRFISCARITLVYEASRAMVQKSEDVRCR